MPIGMTRLMCLAAHRVHPTISIHHAENAITRGRHQETTTRILSDAPWVLEVRRHWWTIETTTQPTIANDRCHQTSSGDAHDASPIRFGTEKIAIE
jgi:hypothetical protein